MRKRNRAGGGGRTYPRALGGWGRGDRVLSALERSDVSLGLSANLPLPLTHSCSLILLFPKRDLEGPSLREGAPVEGLRSTLRLTTVGEVNESVFARAAVRVDGEIDLGDVTVLGEDGPEPRLVCLVITPHEQHIVTATP
eukprot:Hpha_TRINITY_DN15924_c0_g3::TRINITY_DN15924_c0_g3_i1::g.70748::m.70748